jgi:hypothetical protein
MTEPIQPPWEKSGEANMVRIVKVDKQEVYNLQSLYSERALYEKELARVNDLIKAAEELGLKLEESRYEPEEKPEEPTGEIKP